MCSAHATVRGLLGELVARGDHQRDIIVDMEAGLEHLSRGTGKHVSRVLAILEPYYRSMETVRRIAELAAELGVGDVVVIANKVRDEADRQAIGDFCRSHGLRLMAEIPFDASLAESERAGQPPIDHAPRAPAVIAIRRLATQLTNGGEE
jgi:CO dehydrogenase maturation factor